MSQTTRCYTIADDIDEQPTYYIHFGPKWWVELFQMDRVVEVDLTIVPDEDAVETDYYGFYCFEFTRGHQSQEEGLGTHPEVYNHMALLELHYGGGLKTYMERGEGKVVRVRVEEVGVGEED